MAAEVYDVKMKFMMQYYLEIKGKQIIMDKIL